ncbi:MAG TPA: FecR domain-containing protein [Prolixibacteraceae bacterium]|nr:FecR domain-containing protein [Prolixibacteraceae bacterium]
MSLGHMKANQNIEDEKWAALAKVLFDKQEQPLDGTSSVSQNELPAGVNDFEEMDEVANKVELYFKLNKYATAQAWEKVAGRIHQKPQSKPAILRRLITSPALRIAATILMAALLSLAGYQVFDRWIEGNGIIEISASATRVESVTLPDGSLVSLNSNTHLTYPKRFGNLTREVTIEGEAFFEVKPNPKKPFIIHAGTARVKVLGTSFNVRAYPGAREMEVIVKTGKVQVLNQKTEAKQNDELILTPGDKGTLVHQSHALVKSTNENPNYIAWKTHELVFRATSLNEVIDNLENVYKVNIQLQDPRLGGQLLTAHFNNYSLDFILKVIETTFRLQTSQVDGKYILKAKS